MQYQQDGLNQPPKEDSLGQSVASLSYASFEIVVAQGEGWIMI
jgi:hypothetical protein